MTEIQRIGVKKQNLIPPKDSLLEIVFGVVQSVIFYFVWLLARW